MDPLEALEGPRSALMWFEAANVNPGTQYGVYRAALPVAGGGKKRIDGGELLKELKALQLPEQQPKGAPQGKERKWTLLMFGGGHFAGMVVSLVPKLVSKGKGKEKEKEVVVLEQKTFHRYTSEALCSDLAATELIFASVQRVGNREARKVPTTMRTARPSQRALRSVVTTKWPLPTYVSFLAFSSLRANVPRLRSQEVRDLLGSWKDQIDDSELVFLRCSKSNYKTFFQYDDAVLDRSEFAVHSFAFGADDSSSSAEDPRIRGFSFPTRRPVHFHNIALLSRIELTVTLCRPLTN